MDLQDSFPAVDIRTIYQDLPIKPSRTQQSRIEDFRPVGGGHDDDPFVRFESIHLHQELIERLLLFVMSAHDIHSPSLPQGIQFIDENDAGGLAGGLRKKVANARRAHTDEHLHKLRAADAEERYLGLSGHRPGQKGLSRSGYAEQGSSFRNFPSQPLELPGTL